MPILYIHDRHANQHVDITYMQLVRRYQNLRANIHIPMFIGPQKVLRYSKGTIYL